MYQLEVSNCTFNTCILQGPNSDPAILWGDVDAMSADNYTFQLCESKNTVGSDGGGAVYIDHSTRRGIIVNGTFVDNSSKDKGMSVAVFSQSETQRY